MVFLKTKTEMPNDVFSSLIESLSAEVNIEEKPSSNLELDKYKLNLMDNYLSQFKARQNDIK